MRHPARCLAAAVTLAAALPPALHAQGAQLTKEQEIAAAVQPLPPSLQKDAAVYGWRDKRLELLRKGTNGMMCLSDDMAKKNFHVACYHESLDPFMAKGRELTWKGMDRSAIDSARQDDIAKKKWKMPDGPTLLYELSGPEGSYDAATNTVKGARPTYVVYIPYATPAKTGLALEGARGGIPWMMYPGEPWAHIMINP